MGDQGRTVTLYSSQSRKIVDIINETGVNYVKMEFITSKYGEVSSVFSNAYEWYRENAQKIVLRPEQAESAMWAFHNLMNIEKSSGNQVMKLEVPIEEPVFFDMMEWTKVLNMKYIGQSEGKEKAFAEKTALMGIKYQGDIITTSFYPELKKELKNSWNNLFRYHHSIKGGDFSAPKNIQAGLWKIEKHWITEIIE